MIILEQSKREPMYKQVEIKLPSYRRGYHLITRDILAGLPKLPQTGLLHIFVRHTSAAITLPENADPTVRRDFEQFMNKLVPDGDRSFTHILEGDDDMSAHLKASLFSSNLTIPIVDGQPGLGIWQGIYLCEFRNSGGQREVVVTIAGE